MPDTDSVSAAERVRRRNVARTMDEVRESPARWPMGIGSIEAQARIATGQHGIDLRQTLLDIVRLCEITRGAA